jgi:hypothetical protein
VTVSKELSKHELELALVQEVRWEFGGIKLAGEYISMDKEIMTN